MTQAISNATASGFASELAVLLIDDEANQAESARRERDAARADFLNQAAAQVDALHDAASATMSGALVSAAFSVAGGACEIGAAGAQYNADVGKANSGSAAQAASAQFDANRLSQLGNTFDKLAAPADALGKGTAERHQADAQRHETLAEQAKWQSSDASDALDQAHRQSDRALDSLQGIQRDQNSANNSVIGRI